LSRIRDLALEVNTNKSMRREAYSMSLYVSIVLLSALMVFDDSNPPEKGELWLLEAGTTVGLVLAHGFASWVSTRMIGEANEEVNPGDLLLVQLGSALALAGVAMLVVVLVPTSVELVAARLTVAGLIAVQVFMESRSSHSIGRSALYGFLALVVGVIISVVKALLVH